MLKEYFIALNTLLLPPLCFYCERRISGGFLCRHCLEKIELLKPPLCSKCARPLEKAGELCPSCQQKDIFYDRLISIAYYKEPLITLLHLFKYKHYSFLSEFFGAIMKQQLSELARRGDFDAAVPIPLHPTRLREREFNQSRLLAQIIANSLEIPLEDDIIICKKRSRRQALLKRNERSENIKGIFEVTGMAKNKRLILVDDIFTTGATVNECSRILKENKAATITVITLARAQ